MATKTTKKNTKASVTTKTSVKPKTTKKAVNKVPEKKASILTSNVSIVFAMAVEALILFIGYLIIMNAV